MKASRSTYKKYGLAGMVLLLWQGMQAQAPLIAGNDFEKKNFTTRVAAESDPSAWMKYTRVGEPDQKRCPGISARPAIATVERDTTSARLGTYAVKCVLDRSNGGIGHKAMVRNTLYREGAVYNRAGEGRWIAFSVYLPASGPEAYVYDRLPELLFQVHNDETAPPLLSLNCRMDTLSVNYRYAGKDPHTQGRGGTKAPASCWKGPLLKGKWIDWIWHFSLSPTSPSGFLEVWMNRGAGYEKIVALYNIRIGYPCDQLTTCDLGIYKWPWKCPPITNTGTEELKRRVVYIDEVRIGGPGAAIRDMMLEDVRLLNNNEK